MTIEADLRELAGDLNKHGMPACAVFVIKGADRIKEQDKLLRMFAEVIVKLPSPGHPPGHVMTYAHEVLSKC